jgi:hypothetical protein
MNNTTPTVQETGHLNFSEAMAEILAGKNVTKLEWDDKDYYGTLADNRLRLHKPDGQLYDWILSEADLRGEDFVVL